MVTLYLKKIDIGFNKLFYLEYAYLVILFMLFDFIAPKHLVIGWLSNLLILSVSDEDYSRRKPKNLNKIAKID